MVATMVRAIIVIGIHHTTTGAMIRFTPDSMAIMDGDIRAFIQDTMATVGASAGDGVAMDGEGMVMAGVEDMDAAGVEVMVMVADGQAEDMATVVDITEDGMQITTDSITNL